MIKIKVILLILLFSSLSVEAALNKIIVRAVVPHRVSVDKKKSTSQENVSKKINEHNNSLSLDMSVLASNSGKIRVLTETDNLAADRKNTNEATAKNIIPNSDSNEKIKINLNNKSVIEFRSS
jgi:hypothetical protein